MVEAPFYERLITAAFYSELAYPMLHSTLSQVARGAGELDHQTSPGHTVTTVDAHLLNTVVMVLALGVIAGLVVLLVARQFSLQRTVSIVNSGPLSEA